MRRLCGIVVAGLVAFVAAAAVRGARGPEPLVVASFGGAWQDAQRAAIFAPFEKETGIPIVEKVYDGGYEELRRRAESGEWDVVDVEPAELLRGAADGIFEPIDYSGIDRSDLLASAVHPDGVGLMTWSVVLGYDAARFGGGGSDAAAPATWSDFFDLARFPGERALRRSPQWMLEIALLGDGVPPERLYPLDLDRAFQSLDRIASAVVVFDAWSDPVDLLARGEAVMAAGTNGRFLRAREEGGEAVGISWRQQIVASDFFVIAKGSHHKAAAQKLVGFAVGPEAQARIPLHIDYGPVSRRALAAVPADVLPHLPTAPENFRRAVTFDAGWWREHGAEAGRRYAEWVRKVTASEGR